MNKLKTTIKNEWQDLRNLLSKVNPLLMTFFVLAVVAMNLLANKSIDLSWVPGNNGRRRLTNYSSPKKTKSRLKPKVLQTKVTRKAIAVMEVAIYS